MDPELAVRRGAASEDREDPFELALRAELAGMRRSSLTVRRMSRATGARFRLPVARSMTGASSPYRAASHLFSLVRMRWYEGISSPASCCSQSCFTSAWQYAAIATASSTRVTASQIRISAAVRAALVREVGAVAEVGDVAEPTGETIEVLAASINPIDLAVSRGILATGHPELPYVPGCEAVGRTADGRLVWISGGSLGRTSQGAIAERASVGDSHVIDVPDGADPALAAGLGIAGMAGWLPLAWRAPLRGGENVLVLGATGSVGFVAVQTAKLLGAARVVAAGRSAAGLERATQHGADATLRLDEVDDLVAAFKDAFGGEGPSYVFDPLWGEPAAAAVQAAVPHATIVNLGQSAGATSELASAAVRFKNLSILGHTNFLVPPDELAKQYRRLVSHAVAGDIRLDVERVPLDSVADAWRRQAEGAGTKLVVVP